MPALQICPVCGEMIILAANGACNACLISLYDDKQHHTEE